MKVFFVLVLLACVLINIEADGECSPDACKISKDLSLNVKGETQKPEGMFNINIELGHNCLDDPGPPPHTPSKVKTL
ncbi:hypothetical protein RRG08_020459 [Elysia crispata]|uniref:Uncharacterized protein n=1 Tax=Elysia crispata TaxID=231223 RepID=A0AAE0Z2B3_9GAST|nr:hypothetical protein RRG08_020459 [Elysia crispata]